MLIYLPREVYGRDTVHADKRMHTVLHNQRFWLAYLRKRYTDTVTGRLAHPKRRKIPSS